MTVNKSDVAANRKGLNLPQRMERLPLTRYQRSIFLIIATAWLFDSMDLAMMTFILAPISKTFALTPAKTGFLGSASLAGMALGASIAGIIADRIGRKAVFQYSMIMWGGAAILCAVSPSYGFLLVMRFILGFGMGAEFPIAQSMLSEFMPANARGKYIALLEGFLPLGFILAGIVALALVPVAGWRVVFLATGIPAIYVLVIRRKVPEPPRWYEARGRMEEAESTMRFIEGKVEKAYGKPLPEPTLQGVADETATGGFSLWELFTDKYKMRTIMVWVLWFFALLGYYGITTWMGKLLVDKGFAITKSIQFVLFMTLFGVPGFFSAAYLVERLGRKATVVGFVTFSGVAALFLRSRGNAYAAHRCGRLHAVFLLRHVVGPLRILSRTFPDEGACDRLRHGVRLGEGGRAYRSVRHTGHQSRLTGSRRFYAGRISFAIAALNVLLLGPETKGRVLEEVSG